MRFSAAFALGILGLVGIASDASAKSREKIDMLGMREAREPARIASADNARGLYVLIPGGDASTASIGTTQQFTILKNQYEHESALAEEDVLEELADATLDGKRKEHVELLSTVPLLIIDDLGMRKLPMTAAEDLLEIVMRRYERASTLLTSNRPVDDWGKLLGDSAAVTAMLDRLLHHGHVLKCGPRSWRTKTDLPPQEAAE